MQYTSLPSISLWRIAALGMQTETSSSFLKKARSFREDPDAWSYTDALFYIMLDVSAYHYTSWCPVDVDCTGKLRFQTEMGILEVVPGEIAVVQRGIKFKVGLVKCSAARGYILEVYNGHFVLPELGPIGVQSSISCQQSTN